MWICNRTPIQEDFLRYYCILFEKKMDGHKPALSLLHKGCRFLIMTHSYLCSEAKGTGVDRDHFLAKVRQPSPNLTLTCTKLIKRVSF